MNPCERHQAELSALSDGESSAGAVVAALDHVATCTDCCAFWMNLRVLQARLDELDAAPPLRRAAASSVRVSGPRRARPPRRAWIAAAAAALALAVGLSTLPPGGPVRRPAAPRVSGEESAAAVTVHLDAHPRSMDSARFVALAAELLEAGPTYRAEMQNLLARVETVAAPGDERPFPLETARDEDVATAPGGGRDLPLREAELRGPLLLLN